MRNILLLIIILLSGCDAVTNEYATYAEAKKDQLFMRGWLPEILPITTTNIKTVNDLDSNDSYGHFVIPLNDLEKFSSHLTRVSDNIYLYSGSVEWYFTINDKTGYVDYEFHTN